MATSIAHFNFSECISNSIRRNKEFINRQERDTLVLPQKLVIRTQRYSFISSSGVLCELLPMPQEAQALTNEQALGHLQDGDEVECPVFPERELPARVASDAASRSLGRPREAEDGASHLVH